MLLFASRGSVAIFMTTHLLPVCFLLTELAAPPRVDGGLELLQSGGQH